jgi:hypothetical protein
MKSGFWYAVMLRYWTRDVLMGCLRADDRGLVVFKDLAEVRRDARSTF